MNKELVVERYKNPKHFSQELSGFTGQSLNASCGDEIYLGIEIDNGKVVNAKYNGSGCSICLATTDLLIDNILNKEQTEVKEISEKEIFELIGMDENSPRKRCALLSIEAVKNSLNKVQ